MLGWIDGCSSLSAHSCRSRCGERCTAAKQPCAGLRWVDSRHSVNPRPETNHNCRAGGTQTAMFQHSMNLSQASTTCRRTCPIVTQACLTAGSRRPTYRYFLAPESHAGKDLRHGRHESLYARPTGRCKPRTDSTLLCLPRPGPQLPRLTCHCARLGEFPYQAAWPHRLVK